MHYATHVLFQPSMPVRAIWPYQNFIYLFSRKMLHGPLYLVRKLYHVLTFRKSLSQRLRLFLRTNIGRKVSVGRDVLEIDFGD